jgi:hypothetical protein
VPKIRLQQDRRATNLESWDTLHVEHSALGDGIENPIPLDGDQLLTSFFTVVIKQHWVTDASSQVDRSSGSGKSD